MRKLIIHCLVLLLLAVATGCDNPAKGAFLSVDKANCMGCSECVGVCAADAIRIISNKAVIDPTKCVECGNCIEVCPFNAIY